jgi:hypothetical protein
MARPAFIEQQYAFAAHIRNPEHNPAPADIEDRRMAIYRELFYNNVEGFLHNSFPVLRSIMQDADWHAMVRDFLAHYRCHSPLFLEIPREFLSYLDEQRAARADDLPFLRELAHYEWIELALSVAEHEDTAPVDADADLLAGRPALSSLAWPLSYRYPVHRIGPAYLPEQPGEASTYLLVYRDLQDAVGFIELNAVSARLFSLLQQPPGNSGRALLEQIAAELQHPQPEVVIDGGRSILDEWRQRGIIRGCQR